MCMSAPRAPRPNPAPAAPAPVPVSETRVPELEVGEERLDTEARQKRVMKRGTRGLQTGLNIPTYGSSSGSGINVG